MVNPLVTICVPTRNRVASLDKSISNILRQDYASIEVIISDNASSDGTEAFCRDLQRSDSRVTYVRHPRNIGLHGNLNFCLSAGAGEFLCNFHDHDHHHHAIVSTYVAFLLQHPDVGLVCSDWELIDEEGRCLGARDHDVEPVMLGLDYIERTIRSGRSSIGIPGAMIRRSALGSVRFVDSAPVGYGDFPIWFEIAEKWSVGHVSGRLWSWTQSAGSQSEGTVTSMTQQYYENMMQYCEAHLRRWPDHGETVARWKSSVRRFLFWALAYEVALYCRSKKMSGRVDPASSSLPTRYELMNYSLRPEELRDVLAQLWSYSAGVGQRLVALLMNVFIKLNVTWPLAWSAAHHAKLRGILGLG
jgi:hypothetical protein